MGQAKIYLGSTPQAVEENLLAYLNIGQDSPIQRTHPITEEVSLLARLANPPSEIGSQAIAHDEYSLISSLVGKGLLRLPRPSTALYQITDDGWELLREIAQRADSHLIVSISPTRQEA